MKVLPSWLRTMVGGSLPADDQLADELTLMRNAVEGLDRSGSDTVFQMEITTNRLDAMNHHGIARECSALYDLDLEPITPELPNGGDEQFPIQIVEPALCARFSGLVLRDVNVRPSSGMLAQRFNALGQKLINNAADATNYTMFEMGKPTHVYDLDKLVDGKVIVRKATAGEKLRTLDGVERTLHPEDLIIADAEKPVGIGGVIGGEDTKVTEDTRNILIESAWFDTATVRATSKRHGIHTDASHRFERGADYDSCPLAARRVAEIILQDGGGRVGSPVLDNIARKIVIPPVQLRLSQVRRILGKDFTAAELCRILSRLGFQLRGLGEGRFEVTVPTWRLDVSREIDLIEEIARVHGYDKFENRLPAFLGGVTELPAAKREQTIRSKLLALGYNEALSSSFISREDAARFSPKSKPVELENPLSEQRAVMRTSLIPGMLDMVENNLNRNQDEVRLFEIGNTFYADGEQVAQRASLCIASTRPNVLTEWPEGEFYKVKGAVEALFADISADSSIAPADGMFHPGRSAAITAEGHKLAVFGQITVSGDRKLKQPVYLAELDIARLLELPAKSPGYKPLSRFPAVERDFSLILPQDVTWTQVRNAIVSLHIPELQDVQIVETFRGAAIGQDRYSALVRIVLQSAERTLTDAESTSAASRIVQAVIKLGGQLRS